MNWEVLTKLSTLQVQVHWVLAVFAFFIGSLILLRKKGTSMHVLLGRVWVATMVVVSVSALFIQVMAAEGTGPTFLGFSLIHLLVPFTLIMLFYGVANARKKNIRSHRGIMISTFFGSLIVAGAFTFTPGRHMHTFFFGTAEQIQDSIEVEYKK